MLVEYRFMSSFYISVFFPLVFYTHHIAPYSTFTIRFSQGISFLLIIMSLFSLSVLLSGGFLKIDVVVDV